MSNLGNITAGLDPYLVANPDLCTLQTCPIQLAHVQYIPNFAGNLLYIIIFGAAVGFQLFFGVYYRTWGYLAAMLGGLGLEIIGYVGRLQMHSNPFNKGPFLMYLVCLTIGPAFLSAAIYLCLSRIVVAYSEVVSRVKPRTYTALFITCDFFALLLQAAGGGIASTANTPSMDNIGKNIMVAGVSWQVFSIALFAALCAEYAGRVRKAREVEMNPGCYELRQSTRFYLFLWALGGATLAIFVRSVFRCAELSQGFKGKLANQQVTFMILEGAMINIAVILLTAFHPGTVFKHLWSDVSWSFKTRKEEVEAAMDMERKGMESPSDAVRTVSYDETKPYGPVTTG